MITYNDCMREFSRARCKRAGRPIANHTRIRRMSPVSGFSAELPSYAIVYHETPIVIVHADDTYTLDSGGWRTRTTMQRINTYAPAHLSGSCFSGWSGAMMRPGARRGNAYLGTHLRSGRGSTSGGRPWMLYRQGWYDAPGKPEHVGIGEPGRRAYLRAWRAFEAAHTAPFYDGVRIGADGWPIDTGLDGAWQAYWQNAALAESRPRAETAAMAARRRLRESLQSGDPFTLGDAWRTL